MATPIVRKAVKTITVGGITGGIVSASPFHPITAETDTIAAYGDEVSTNVPRALANLGEITVTVLDEGQAFSTLASQVVTASLAVTYHDGTNAVTRTLAEQPCVVKGVAPGGEVAVDGERRSTIVLTLQAVGGTALSANALPAGGAAGA